MTGTFVDAHFHLSRTVEQERLAYSRPRAALDKWFPNHEARVDELMDFYGMSHMVVPNVMSLLSMIERRMGDVDATGDQKDVIRQQLTQEMRGRLQRFNRWLLDLARRNGRVLPCVCIDPNVVRFDAAFMTELDEMVGDGAVGFKMHPSMAGFRPNERRLWPLFEKLQAIGLPVIFDTGADVSSSVSSVSDSPFGEPELFEDMLRDFPRLPVVMAHLGSAYFDERLALAAQHDNVWFDTSGGFAKPNAPARGGERGLSEKDAPRVIRKIGVERVMFGSDSSAVVEQALQIASMPFSDGELEMILGKTALDLFSGKQK